MQTNAVLKLAELGKPFLFRIDDGTNVAQPAVIDAINAARLTGHAVLVIGDDISQSLCSGFYSDLKTFIEKISVRKGELEVLAYAVSLNDQTANWYDIYCVDHPNRVGRIPGKPKSHE